MNPLVGSSQAHAVVGASQAERAAPKPRKREPERSEVKRHDDEVSIQPESTEAIRALKRNDDEESQQDRHAHTPSPRPATGKKPLDLEA